MARPRTFDETEVLVAATEIFTRTGYEGTSIDDLVIGLGLHRGSLYQAFGSKRGLFAAALTRSIDGELATAMAVAVARGRVGVAAAQRLAAGTALDLLLVAAIELAPVDAGIAAEVERAYRLIDVGFAGGWPIDQVPPAAVALGLRVLRRSKASGRAKG
ncbi:MAG: TetR/AcrR family transcriptional regulator [Acidothermaceae bacterium]